MTYEELYEKRWNGETERSVFLGSLDIASKRAWLAIEMLDGRGGFDHWWDDIDFECKNEIFDELREKLKNDS